MTHITKPLPRQIIDDFAKEIQQKKLSDSKPTMTVINFRSEQQHGKERPIVRIPLESLRFRKDNGRIASDVLDYERNTGPLDETDEDSQNIIREFLKKKDPEKTEALRKSIIHDKQREPAIITCDGFLINGNRRKMVLDGLHKDHPEKDEYMYLKAVILPGPDDEGGPPTDLEIEKLENRYQLQSDGRSEYSNFDRALSIRRKVEHGFPLEDQLRDDPRFTDLNTAGLKKEVQKYVKDYIRPLECVDRYLEKFHREGLYSSISARSSDREGRWQAFVDYSDTYQRLIDPKFRLENGIDEDDIGTIEDSAFKIIRLRELKGQGKVHKIMRDLTKLLGNPNARKEILKIADEVDAILPSEDCFDKNGTELEMNDVDHKWAEKFQKDIICRVKKAIDILHHQDETETPITLLQDSLNKLINNKMDISNIKPEAYKNAHNLTTEIQRRAHELEQEIYRHEKNWKSISHR